MIDYGGSALLSGILIVFVVIVVIVRLGAINRTLKQILGELRSRP